MSYLAKLREMNFSKHVSTPTAKTVKRVEGATFDSFDSDPEKAFSKITFGEGNLNLDLSEIDDCAPSPNSFREGPPYPDGRGRVKCFYCCHLAHDLCRHNNQRMTGISLLRTCQSFSMENRR